MFVLECAVIKGGGKTNIKQRWKLTQKYRSYWFHIQVIAGAGMDVDFTIISPEGTRLVTESRRSDGVHL